MRTTQMTIGPARYFVPVCKHPRDYAFTFGPLGYEEMEEVAVSPLCVESGGRGPFEIMAERWHNGSGS